MRFIRQNAHSEPENMAPLSPPQGVATQENDPAGARTQDLRIKSASGTRIGQGAHGRQSVAHAPSNSSDRTHSVSVNAESSAKKPTSRFRALALGGALTWGGR
jgi:hypothetical protein